MVDRKINLMIFFSLCSDSVPVFPAQPRQRVERCDISTTARLVNVTYPPSAVCVAAVPHDVHQSWLCPARHTSACRRRSASKQHVWVLIPTGTIQRLDAALAINKIA